MLVIKLRIVGCSVFVVALGTSYLHMYIHMYVICAFLLGTMAYRNIHATKCAYLPLFTPYVCPCTQVTAWHTNFTCQ